MLNDIENRNVIVKHLFFEFMSKKVFASFLSAYSSTILALFTKYFDTTALLCKYIIQSLCIFRLIFA